MILSRSFSRFSLALSLVFLSCLVLASPGEALFHDKTMSGSPGGAPDHRACDETPGLIPPELLGIDLTEIQQDKLFLIFHEQAPALRSAMKKERKAEEELRAQALAPRFDEARARALALAAGKAHAEIAFLHVKTKAQIQALLTPEQRDRIERAGHRPPPSPRFEP